MDTTNSVITANKMVSIACVKEPTCLKDPAIPKIAIPQKLEKPNVDFDRATVAMGSMATFLSTHKSPISSEDLRKSPVVSYFISGHPDKAAAAANFGYKKKAFTPEDLHVALAQEILDKLPIISKLEKKWGIEKPGRITLRVIEPGLKVDSLDKKDGRFAVASIKEGLISAARQNSYVATILPQFVPAKQADTSMDEVYKAIHAAKLHTGSGCCVHVKDN